MTNGELHLILDDENKKLTKRELLNVLCELEHDSKDMEYKMFAEYHVAANKDDWEVAHAKREQLKFYQGESNAFHIALMLAEHLEGE